MRGIDIAGGVGLGITRGLEDLDRQKQQKFEETQRSRTLRLQAEQDALEAELRTVRPTGTYKEAISLGEGQGGSGGEAMGERTVTRSDADVARDFARKYTARGRPVEAAAQSDRAYSLGKREFTDKAFDLANRVRMGKTSLVEAAQEAAVLKTADGSPVHAFVKNADGGMPTIRAYNAKSGEWSDMPITSPQQMADLIMSSTSPEALSHFKQEARADATLGIHSRTASAAEKSAEASAQKAKTDADEFAHKKLTGLFESQVAENKAKAALYPAQAAHYLAEAKKNGALAESLAAKAQSLEDKLPEGQRMFLGMLKDRAKQMDTLAANDPKFQTKAQGASYDLFKAYREAGMDGIDEFKASGVPRPEAAAVAILKDKPNPKAIAEQIQKAEAIFGKEYAQDVAAQIDKLRPAQPGKPQPLPPGAAAAPGVSPMGVRRQVRGGAAGSPQGPSPEEMADYANRGATLR